MGWLFGQVWVLCVLAFLLGSAVTWLAFVRPLRGRAPETGGEWTPVPAWASGRPASAAERSAPSAPVVPPAAGPAVDPALAALDARSPGRPAAGPGVTATGALDLLGVAGARPADLGIPSQATPVDSPDPGGQPDERRH